MGRLISPSRTASLVLAALLVLLLSLPLACAQYSTGRYHTVARGETLYRIGQSYGVAVTDIVKANSIDDVRTIQIGERIWIPRPQKSGKRNPAGQAIGGRKQARRTADLEFIWPVQGARMSSRFGSRRGRPHEGIDLAVRHGTLIRASEAGKVIHSGWLGDYGKVVIIKHAGAYRTVYAHASRLHVARGEFVEKGQKIASVGSTGRSSGPHLHFEIRKRETPRNPIAYLP